MLNKLLSATLTALITTASLAAPAAAQTAITSEVPQTKIVASSRSVTSTRLLVNYAVNDRRFTMIGDHTSPDETRIDIVEGSRVVVTFKVDRAGSATLTNHLGRTYSVAELEANPALGGNFDFEALLGLDPTAMGYLVTGQGGTALNPCAINPWVALCCLGGAGIGAGLAYFIGSCDPYLTCGPYGCHGGFNCGD
jgi:hypothetical protein